MCDNSPRSQTECVPRESCSGTNVSSTSTPGLLFSITGSSGQNSDVLHAEKRVLPALDGKQCILDRTQPSKLYRALRNSLQAPDAGEAFPCSRMPRVCRGGLTRPVVQNRTRKYSQSGHSRLAHRED